MSNCRGKLVRFTVVRVEYDRSNRVCIRRTGNKSSRAVAQGANFSTGGQTPSPLAPALVTLKVCAFSALFKLRADDSRTLCLKFTPSALTSVLSFTPKSTSAKPVWNFGKWQPKFFTEEALPVSISLRDVPGTRDKSQVKQLVFVGCGTSAKPIRYRISEMVTRSVWLEGSFFL